MQTIPIPSAKLKPKHQLVVTLTSLLVAVYGLYIIAITLLVNIVRHHHHHDHITSLTVDLPLLVGLSVVYLSTLLRRRKRTAWIVTIMAYAFYLSYGVLMLISRINNVHYIWIEVIRSLVLPLIIISLLIMLRREFVVKSDTQSFRFALRFIVIIFLITIIYGVSGFVLLDKSDFHREIGFPTALHYTVDQFNITTTKPVVPYTRRAHLFLDSLSFVSTISVVYALFSLFQPIKSRLTDQTHNRDRIKKLLNQYGGDSEEFFKIWPHDKQYFFGETGESAVAFHVYRGVALCLSDPIGNPKEYKNLMDSFDNLCFGNDWLPALVHVSDNNLKMYESCGYSMQKLGQEAIVDIDHFMSELKNAKYFRQIMNKFNKQGYSYELLKPPHHQAVVDRLKSISGQWLSKGSRSERGFAMGYFTEDYMQLCDIAIARDAAGTIQGFANIVPAEFDKEEATYDILRQSDNALSNINDYLLINLIDGLSALDYKRLNMGLSPLSGLDQVASEQKTILDNVLKFAYANGDLFFSFSGLNRFKSKYEPRWQDKYLGYKGGLTGFSKSITALTRCMSKVVKL
jgi:phosphatidylglycerol lysyltransferase